MRYVLVPAPISVINRFTCAPMEMKLDGRGAGELSAPVSFREYAYACWLNDPKWATPLSRLRRLAAVCDLLDAQARAPNEPLALEDQDWEILSKIAAEPGTRFSPLVEIQLEPFRQALQAASKECPKSASVVS